MSRPRYWWYDYVQKSIRHSMSRINSGTEPATLQEAQATFATRKALDELKNKDRAPEREEFTRKLFSSKKYARACYANVHFRDNSQQLENGICVSSCIFHGLSVGPSPTACALGFIARGAFLSARNHARKDS